MQNDGDKIDWDPVSDHCKDKYCIAYNHYNQRYETFEMTHCKPDGTVFFYSKAIALRAIEEIVFPFMKEHPDFVW